MPCVLSNDLNREAIVHVWQHDSNTLPCNHHERRRRTRGITVVFPIGETCTTPIEGTLQMRVASCRILSVAMAAVGIGLPACSSVSGHAGTVVQAREWDAAVRPDGSATPNGSTAGPGTRVHATDAATRLTASADVDSGARVSIGSPADGGRDQSDSGRSCVHPNGTYKVGDGFRSEDGCFLCTCESGPRLVCAPQSCSARTDAGSLDAGACTAVSVGRLCVRGTEGANGESVSVGDKLVLQIFPQGCFSSGCTRTDLATCSVTSTGFGSFTAQGEFCIGGGGSCTLPDCSGGGFASCESATQLTQGRHTVVLGSLSVAFTVPSTLPLGGLCDGS